ncbi:hypothetical protein GW17_00053038, partial [Ensete ventricosum]
KGYVVVENISVNPERGGECDTSTEESTKEKKEKGMVYVKRGGLLDGAAAAAALNL